MELSNHSITHHAPHSVIRTYQSADYQQVLQLAQHYYIHLYDTPSATTQAFMLDMLHHDPDVHCLVVIDAHNIVGFILYTLHRYAGARINYLVVAAHARNKGYANSLVAAAIQHALLEHYESIVVTVLETNSHAIDWYIKRGFVPIDNYNSYETELIYLEKNIKI